MLDKLVELYDRLAEEGKVEREGWCRDRVTFRLMLGRDGSVKGLEDARVTLFTKNGKPFQKAAILPLPERIKRSGSAPRSNVYCDNGYYIFGVTDPEQEMYGKRRFMAAKRLHELVLDGVKSAAAEAVIAYFNSWNPDTAYKDPVLVPWLEELASATILFNVEGEDVTEDEACKAAWEAFYERSEAGNAEVFGTDLVTGEENVPIARLLPSLRGVKGGKPTGCSLVSYNQESFEHFGKVQGYNSPISQKSAYKIGTALQYLNQSPDHKIYLGNTLILFWSTKEDPSYETLFANLLTGGSSEADREVLSKMAEDIEHIRPAEVQEENLDKETAFYVMGLQPNAARLSLLFFLEDSFGHLTEKILRHQKRLRLFRTKPYGYISAWNLAMAGLGPNENLSPRLYEELGHAILEDHNYPLTLFRQMIRRTRAEKGAPNYVRTAFMKAYLMKNKSKEWGNLTMGLDTNCTKLPYVLGRLFSVAEEIQDTVAFENKRRLGASIRDKYFNAVCTNPAANFPVVLKLTQSHLSQLSPGAKVRLGKKLGDILKMLDVSAPEGLFPKVLSLEDQGAFIVGYFQENQERYVKKNKAAEEG